MGLEYHAIQDGWLKLSTARFYPHPTPSSARLMLGLNQLLLRMDGKTVLIDTGLGEVRAPQEMGLLDYEKPRGLIGQLNKLGVAPEEVDILILTHLHYDHSGGTVQRRGEKLAPTFTKAIYYIQKAELDWARRASAAGSTSYRSDLIEALTGNKNLRVVDGDAEPLPGLRLYLAPGHTPGHQVVMAHRDGTVLFAPGDLIATRDHIRQPVSKANNTDLAELLNQRHSWYNRARNAGWLCLFSHAIREPLGYLE